MTDPTSVRVWLIEDNERLRKTLATAINAMPGLYCDADFGAVEPALAYITAHSPPNLILLDIGLPGIDGIAGLPRIRAVAPAVKIVILTVFDDHDRVFRAVCAGADGYLLKTSPMERISEAIREVSRGGASMNPEIARKVLDLFSGQKPKQGDQGLTERELDVLRHVVNGLTKKEIAARLDLSQHTVDSHLRNIYQKLHVNNRAGAVATALRERLV
jgi:DNA-binding NarL/FixJ family response regulator